MAEQTVFVVIGGWMYEGYAAPLAVFSTRPGAVAFADEQTGFDEVNICEMRVCVVPFRFDEPAKPDVKGT